MEISLEQPPAVLASEVPEAKPYIVGTFARKIYIVISIILLIILLIILVLATYSYTHFIISKWIIFSFWIPFVITFIALLELWFLPSMFAVSAEERKTNRLLRIMTHKIPTWIIIILFALIVIVSVPPPAVGNSWIPALSGTIEQRCSDRSTPGALAILPSKYGDTHFGPCEIVPAIYLSYLVEIAALLCIVFGIRRYFRIKDKIRLPDSSTELHFNSQIEPVGKGPIFLVLGFFLVLAVLAVVITFMFQ